MSNAVEPPPASGPPPGWEERRIDVDGESHVVLLRPGTGGEGETAVLPAAPRVALDDARQPRLSLTLLLRQWPAAADDVLDLIVASGLVTFVLDVGVDAAVLDALHAADGSTFVPLFARSAVLTLEAADRRPDDPVATVEGAGPRPQLAVSATLSRDQALAVWHALDGGESALACRLRLSYRTQPERQTVRLAAASADVHDAIVDQVDREGAISRAALADLLPRLIADGVVVATSVTADGRTVPFAPADDPTLFDAFMRVSGLLLERLTPELPSTDPANRYAVRPRPLAAMPLNVTQTITAARDETLEQVIPLEAALGGILDDLSRDKFVHLQLVGGNGHHPPRRVRTAHNGHRTRGSESPVGLVAWADRASSIDFALAATQPTNAHALLTSDFAAIHGQHFATGDLVAVYDDADEGRPRPLPIVADHAAALWPDGVDGSLVWYAPTFELIQPAPNSDPAISPFVFTFARTGVTTGGALQPGLSATVRFTLRPVMSAATVAALAERGNPRAQAVPLNGLSVVLDIPFRDEGTRETKVQRLAATVTRQGEEIIATVDLLDNAVRLAYGALAYPGFQEQPAALSAAYVFQANVPLKENATIILVGDKLARTEIVDPPILIEPILDPAILRIERPVFVAPQSTLLLQSAAIRFSQEAARTDQRDLDLPHRRGETITDTTMMILSPAIAAAKPQLLIDPNLFARLPKIEYGTETIGREERLTVVFPCDALGGLYLEELTDGTVTAIGCQDALRLGEITYRQYEELEDLRDRHVRVFTSLTQPGRFLVLPAAYRIARYAPDDPGGRPYQPAIMIYAALTENAADNRYFFTATLHPDLPPFALHALETRLQPETPAGQSPQLDFPTTLSRDVEPSYLWALPSEIAAPTTMKKWEGFQVSLSTSFVSAALLTTMLEATGVEGQVVFEFADGTSLPSQLVLDGALTGPWGSGPLETTWSTTSVTLLNRIERRVDVSELIVRDAAGGEQRVAVDRSLAPEEAATVAVAAAAAVWPVYTIEPGPLRLTEQDVFIEDVTANVIVINQINHANHQLRELLVEVRRAGSDVVQTVTLAEASVDDVDLTFALTDYLIAAAIEFRVTKRFLGDKADETTTWRPWNLTTEGNVIGLTWDAIA